MADTHTGASVVIVDPKRAAEERDRRARALLSDGAPVQRTLTVMSGVAHTVPYTLKIATDATDVAEAKLKAEEVLQRAFKECDDILNTFNPESEISKVNQAKANEVIAVSPTLNSVLRVAMQICVSTGGAFDPATAPAAEYLHKYVSSNGKLPPPQDETLERLMQLSGAIQNVTFDFRDHTLVKKHGEVRFDLGGINKGWTVDRVIELLQECGISAALFEWGGDAKACGRSCRNEIWRVGIVRPPGMEELSAARTAGGGGGGGAEAAGEKHYLRVIELQDEAVATSGDYENLIPNAPPTTTILDTRERTLLQPASAAVAQVTIKNYSCMAADALATAALVKRDFTKIRYMLDNWRYVRFAVTDYTAYIRDGERVARMHEIARESSGMRANRIASALPARVVVVGGGLAGCCAAIEAAACGSSVILLEKMDRLGGNSAKATSGINGWGTRPQAERDIIDGPKFFERDTHRSGRGGATEVGLVQVLSVKSGEAIEWLSKTFDIPLTVVSQLGGHSRPRTHRAPDKPDGTPVPIGYTIMQQLIKYINTKLQGKVTVMTKVVVEDLMHETHEADDGTPRTRIYGVRYRVGDSADVFKLPADAVILTTGGFGNDRTDNSLLREFSPHLSQVPTTNGNFATGDGVKMGRRAGALLQDMDKVQLHPTGLIDPKDPANRTKYLGPEALRGSGGILLNRSGRRFVNELDLRSVVSKAIQSQGMIYPESDGAPFAYCVLSAAAVKLFGPNALAFYKDKLGLFVDAPDVDALAKLIGASRDVLVETLRLYGQSCATKQRCPRTGKSVFPSVVDDNGPYVVAIVTPSIHYTMGGLSISPAAEVQASVGHKGIFGTRRPMRGLFAAGEVSAGVHGGNRLGGNSLLECVVFGRIAGDRAATILQRKPIALSDEWCTVVLREIREGGTFGHGSRILRFNLPGALQISGLKVGQFVAIRGEWDGQQLVGYYSPITLPDDIGVIGLLCRVDKGTLKDWISALRPGDAVEMRAFGGLAIDRVPRIPALVFEGRVIRKIGMIAGGAGVAPMLQILRAALKAPYREMMDSLRLLYAAEELSELTYHDVLKRFERESSRKFRCHVVLNNPSQGWTAGVGFIDSAMLIDQLLPPSDDHLIVICGPPVMQRIVKANLLRIGHDPSLVRTVDEAPPSASSSKL